MLIISGIVQSQNFIKEMGTTDDFSIIRNVSDKSWLTYSETEGRNYFIMVTETGISMNMINMTTTEIHVSDFEIYHDTVFFCGSKKVNNIVSYAAMGYFPLSGFPNVTVKYNYFPELYSLEKMDVYSTGWQTHVAMTAFKSLFESTIVDIRHTSGDSWLCNVVVGLEYWDIFDDVLATSRHVVFSSRRLQGVNHWVGAIWNVARPTLPGVPIFMSSISRYGFNNIYLKKPVLLADIGNDWFVTAAVTEYDSIIMHRFGNAEYGSSAKFKGVPDFDLMDLNYVILPNSADVLTNTYTQTGIDSRIYHISESAFDENGTANIHYYPGESINSIDLSAIIDGIFVASGHGGLSQYLRIYRYQYNKYKCAIQKQVETEALVYEPFLKR